LDREKGSWLMHRLVRTTNGVSMTKGVRTTNDEMREGVSMTKGVRTTNDEMREGVSMTKLGQVVATLLVALGSMLAASPADAVLLNVPIYKQCDPAWGDDTLGTCNTTMCRAGCAVTSSSMLYTYYGGTRDPGQLNDCLTNNAGYANGCLIYWQNACMPQGVSFDRTGTADDIDGELAAGYPVITWVSNGSTSMHFVVIVGNENGEYQINDPYWDYHTISAGGYTIEETRLYNGTAAMTCEQVLTADGPTIIDDQDPCFLRHGSYWWDEASGYDGHHYYTYAIDAADHDCWAQWRFDVIDAQDYDVEVYLPDESNSSVHAPFVVVHNGGSDQVIVDQASGSGWVSLGQFTFASGSDQYVALNDNTGEPVSQRIPVRFDAVRLSPVSSGGPDGGVTADGNLNADAGLDRDGAGDQDSGGSGQDGSTTGDAGSGARSSGGCDCRSTGTGGGPQTMFVLFVLAVFFRSRRRRAQRRSGRDAQKTG